MGTVLAVEPTVAGGGGDFSATTLAPSASWSAGSNTGGFSWEYPLRVPPAPSELGPDLSLSYDRVSVDGRTSSTNNQTSWVGEGFDLEPGYVERKYVPCSQDMKEESGKGKANNTTRTGDLCWRTDNATLVLGGRASDLVRVGDSEVWKFVQDDGSTIRRFTGADNGDDDGEYWRLTTPDGTQYFFGRGKRYTADTVDTQSALTVPVAGTTPTSPGTPMPSKTPSPPRRGGGTWTTWSIAAATP
jgi:hypothetical protein